MKHILPSVFVLALCAIAWITGSRIPQSMTPIMLGVLMGMFPGILIALIALRPGSKKPVISSEFSQPLRELNRPVGSPHNRN